MLSLDPRFPLVWRTPSSVQLGIATPVAVLENVSAAMEGMLAALSSGITRSGLELIAREAGADNEAVDTLLDAVGPALTSQRGPQEAAPPVVLLVGRGPLVDGLAAVLSTEGVAIIISPDASSEAATTIECDLAVVCSHFVLAPELHGTWLRRDIPHLSVVFSDSVVEVGPLVEPGVGPCLYCLERHRTDADEAWPAIATQLWGRRSRLETALIAGEVAALVARLTLERVRRVVEPPSPETVMSGEPAAAHRLDPATGEWTRSMATPHPHCGCVLLDIPASV